MALQLEFKEEWLNLSDEQLGIRLLSSWIAFQANLLGASSFEEVSGNSASIIADIARLNIDNIKNLAIEKALKFIIEGNPSRGGAMFREYLMESAKDLHIQELARKGEKFRPARKLGSLSEKTKYIYKLVENNPDLTAKGLYKIADKEVLGAMPITTFSNHVSKFKKKQFSFHVLSLM